MSTGQVKVYLRSDTMTKLNGIEEIGWWLASCDINGTPAYDSSGRSPLEAVMRLAEDMGHVLAENHGDNDDSRQ